MPEITLEKYFYDSLYNRGLFENQAADVLAKFKETAENHDQSMAQRWNDRVSDYPSSIVAVLGITLDSVALDWLNENAPQHWAKPSSDEREELFQKHRGGTATNA